MKTPHPSSRALNKAVGHCAETGKAQFSSRTAAKNTAQRYDRTMRAYRCDCGYWHLGHGYGQTREWHRLIHGRSEEV